MNKAGRRASEQGGILLELAVATPLFALLAIAIGTIFIFGARLCARVERMVAAGASGIRDGAHDGGPTIRGRREDGGKEAAGALPGEQRRSSLGGIRADRRGTAAPSPGKPAVDGTKHVGGNRDEDV